LALYNAPVSHWVVPEKSPRASADRIKRFVNKYGDTTFRHAQEIVPLMRRDDPDETRITVHEFRLYEGLRSIYSFRATRPASSPPSPQYPPGLADDLRDLATQFDAAPDQPLSCWMVRLPSGLCYTIWELLDDRRIAGCVKSADQRVVNPHPW